MPRSVTVVLLTIHAAVLAVSVTCSAQPRTPPGPGPASPSPSAPAMKFTRLGIRDPGINDIEAVSLLIPAGWKADGGVQWFPDYSILANLLLRVGDPQTGAVIEFLPVQNFTWLKQMAVPMAPGTNYMGNILWQPIGDIPRFIQTFYMPKAMTRLQSARIVGGGELPRVAAAVAQSYGGQSQVKSARVRYEYTQNGQPWEEDVFVTLVFTPWQLGTLWSVNTAHSFRTPKGILDRMTPIMSATVNSVRISPEWYGGYMYVQQLFNNRMNQSIKNAAAISRTVTQNSEEIRRMYSESYRQRQESQDRISQSWSEYIRGVETYKNPFEGRQVQLPSGYSNAWVNARGEYLLTNQAGLNPNVGDTTEWRRMDRRQ